MRRKQRDTSTLVAGFSDEGAVDRFVMAEIRYFKSMEMQVYRCEGDALRFDFQDLPPVTSIFRELSHRYPDLRFFVDDGTASVELRAGDESAAADGAGFREHRPIEEIYSTF